MCFSIHPDHPDKKIAKRDITCYKILQNISGELFSRLRGFEYKLNKLYKTKIDEPQLGEINRGFHSNSNKHFLKRQRSCIISSKNVKCIIPKGSEYYYDPIWREYVSNQIIIKEIIS